MLVQERNNDLIHAEPSDFLLTEVTFSCCLCVAEEAHIKYPHTFHFGYKTFLLGVKFSNISCPTSINLVHHSLAKLQACINHQKRKKDLEPCCRIFQRLMLNTKSQSLLSCMN